MLPSSEQGRAKPRREPLPSTREREICLEVISGHTTAEIADRLSISPHTIQDHLKAAFAKVGVRSRGELAATLRPDDLTYR